MNIMAAAPNMQLDLKTINLPCLAGRNLLAFAVLAYFSKDMTERLSETWRTSLMVCAGFVAGVGGRSIRLRTASRHAGAWQQQHLPGCQHLFAAGRPYRAGYAAAPIAVCRGCVQVSPTEFPIIVIFVVAWPPGHDTDILLRLYDTALCICSMKHMYAFFGG